MCPGDVCPGARVNVKRRTSCRQGSRQLQLCKAFNRPTRLASSIITVPRRVELYFEGHPLRLAVWIFNCFGLGYYSAVSVSLSFGALAINDVVAAAVTVVFCEVVSYWFYSAEKKTIKHILSEAFKVGAMSGLIADAGKLAG